MQNDALIDRESLKGFKPYTPNHDCNRFESVLFSDKITIGNEMSV